MAQMPEPPKTYQDFRTQYAKLGQAWDLTAEAGKDGPLDEKMQRLVKLAISVGAMRKGAVHSGVRKAVATGVPREAIQQVAALAAGTIGFPSTVAIFSWIAEELEK